MNADTVIIILMALAIFVSTITALMFYTRHWSDRQEQLAKESQLTEGTFLKRYIPPQLRFQYDVERMRRTDRKQIHRRTLARLQIIGVGGVAMLVISGALYANRYRLMQPIDLTPQEVMGLKTMKATWSPVPENDLPYMEARAALLRKQGVAVIASLADENRIVNGQRLTLMAETHWQHFFDRWNIPYRLCGWKELASCIGGRIGIVMPGTWRLNELDRAIRAGASVLLYGPPSSVLTDKQVLQWNGLTFRPFINGTARHLALRGDQLLTLGFDAGLILMADHAFSGYQVSSDSPQAVGISSTHEAGGVVDTRIYAKGIGRGRVVWMDYAPDDLDQPPDIDVDRLEAINAAIFRYLLKETYAGWAMWPEGRRFAGMISQDSEDKYHYSDGVVSMVKEHNFPITWFMLANESQLSRSLTQRMAEVGEVACHGDNHSAFPLGDLLTQTERIARCAKIVSTITGHNPHGFRPPSEKYNSDTINAIAGNNMSYYFAEAGIDRLVPVMMQENKGTLELVSLPRMVADDYEMWHTLKLNYEDSLRLADDQLGWVSDVGGFIPFDFHTQYMDSKEHLEVVEHYGLRFKKPDCYFGTAGQISNWWRVRTALINDKPVASADLAKYQPVRLRVDAKGRLVREPVNAM